jgi:hypothetical protein
LLRSQKLTCRAICDIRIHEFKAFLKESGVTFETILETGEKRHEVFSSYFSLLASLCLSSGGIPRKEDWYGLRRGNFSIGHGNIPSFSLKVAKQSASINAGTFSLAFFNISPVLTFMDFFGWPTSNNLKDLDVKQLMEQEMQKYVMRLPMVIGHLN